MSDALIVQKNTNIFTAIITATYPAGATCTCTMGGRTYTAKDTTGSATFKVHKAGTWVVAAATATESSSADVVIERDGQTEAVALSFRAVASTTPTTGVTYTNGISGLGADEIGEIACAIAKNAAITKTLDAVYIDWGVNSRKITVGDQVYADFSGNAAEQNKYFLVAGFNHDNLVDANAYGETVASGKAGITFKIATMWDGTAKISNGMTGSDTGGWNDSYMRTSTMPQMKSYMPSDWQDKMKKVLKPTSRGKAAGGAIYNSEDECFLFSSVELSGSTSISAAGEGEQYQYFKAGNSIIGEWYSTSSNQMIAYEYWTRSDTLGLDNTTFNMVTTNGSISTKSTTSALCVVFAFCI